MRRETGITIFLLAIFANTFEIVRPAHAQGAWPNYVCVYTDQNDGATGSIKLNLSDPNERRGAIEAGDEFILRLTVTGGVLQPGDGSLQIGTIRIFKSSGLYLDTTIYVDANGRAMKGLRATVRTGKCHKVAD